MYSFLDLGAFLLQGKKIQESAIQFLVKFVRFGSVRFGSVRFVSFNLFSQALKALKV